MVKFKDLREWIEQAKKINELVVLEDADIEYEMAAISQLSCKSEGPAILHQKIKGYPPNFRVITSMMSNIRTLNLTYGLPIENSIKDTVEALRTKVGEWEKDAVKFPPKIVDKSPLMENVLEGDKVDLTKFPVPFWHELDGGRYIGTADGIITRDPDTGVVNMGTYRSQLFDGKNVGMMVTHGHHGRLHRAKYFERNQPCPVVIVYGQDPLQFAISATSLPPDMSEFNYIGAMRGEPLPMIKGKATGLPIPANAEIAIEGFAYPNEFKKEGRFGEWQGYYAGNVTDQPFVKVSTVYHRNDPILTGAPPAKGAYCDFTFFFSVTRAANIWNELIAAGVPGVKGVFLPTSGCAYYLQVVSIEQLYGGHATQAGHAVAHSRSGAFAGRYTVVVDDDIDPYDLEDVMWAICTRSLPTDVDVIKKSWGSHSEPMYHRLTTDATDSTPPRAVIYAVKPYEWRNDFAPVNIASKELRERVYNKWKGAFKDRLKSL
jgi:UbiD family decarboxylase